MSVTVIDFSTSDERQVRVDIAGGPTLTKKYGSRQYRVTRVVITYRRSDGQPWEASNVDLSGPNVKKDGSDGVDTNRDHLWNSGDWPDWVLEMVERYAPEPGA